MAQKEKFLGWRMVWVFVFIYLINGAFPYAGGSVINSFMAKALSMDRSTLGLGFTIFGITVGLVSILAGILVTKKGVRFTVFMGSLILALGAFLMSTQVNEAWHFVIIYGMVVGCGAGLSTVVPLQSGVTLWFSKKRAFALSLVLSAGGVGAFLAAPLLNKIITASGGNWRRAWWVEIFLFCVVAAVAILFIKNKPSDVGQYPDGEEPDDAESSSPSGHGHGSQASASGKVYRSPVDWKVSQAMKTRSIWLIIAGGISFLMCFSTFMAHGVIHLQDVGLTHVVAAFSVGLMLAISIVGRLLSGVLGDRMEPRYVYACALVIMSVGCIAAMNASSSVYYMYVYDGCIGIGFGASYVSQSAMIANYFGGQAFASVMGVLFPIMSISANCGPYFAGLIYDSQKSYNIAFTALAIFTFMGAVAIILANPPAVEREMVA